jgi:threonine/homoserine/homoserine lactone efflux protein
MFGATDLVLFVLAGILLNITPGPDTLYIIGRTASQGLRGGTVAALGISAGLLVHALAAAVGLSAVLSASAAAFTVIKWIGAAYLIYLGISLLTGRPSIAQPASGPAPATLRTVFFQGFLTNVLNPKVALFFLAFLPQFVDPGASSKVLALMFLGLVFNINGTLWNLFVAWLAARMTRRLNRSGYLALWLQRAVGALFVYLGIRLVAADES